MNTKQHFAKLFEAEIQSFLYEILDISSYSREEYTVLENHYRVALRILRETPHEFVVSSLDENFVRCKMRYAFVYDHAKECHLRGDVVTYEEYKEFNQRFPRAR